MYTRRGDLESLMYNGLEWLKLSLPWKDKTLPKTIKSKTEMKEAILAADSKGKIDNFDNIPQCKYKLLIFVYISKSIKNNYMIVTNYPMCSI